MAVDGKSGERRAAHASDAISKRQHALILIGLGLGTLMEWYDFQLYSGLSSTLSKEFFPADSAVAQARRGPAGRAPH
jgi:hypothetical protein